MTIKTLSTYYLSYDAFTGKSSDTVHDQDRTTFPDIPNELSDLLSFLKDSVQNGSLPSTRQPQDSVVRTATEIIITTVWLNKTAAENYCLLRRNSSNEHLISCTVIED